MDRHVQNLGDERRVEIGVCVIRGYYVYKDVWDPNLGDGFTTKHKQNNSHDKYTVAVLPVGVTTAPTSSSESPGSLSVSVKSAPARIRSNSSSLLKVIE